MDQSQTSPPISHDNDLTDAIIEQVGLYRFKLSPVSVGTVNQIGDGIAYISGLHDIMVGEMIEFDDGTLGLAMNLEMSRVGAVALGNPDQIVEGSTVRALGKILSVPVGQAMIGRVVDALGRPIDDEGPIESTAERPVENKAPGIMDRESVNEPLETGIKAIDALVPIGRGQRELIVGDRQTGKTTIAIDAIINQHAEDVLCVYVAIGQKLSSVAQTVETLRQNGAMDHTVIVVAQAGSPAPLQYIAPYAGCAIAEEFMAQGRDVLIVYDDLTKHAWAYRQISLLLRRPPGREAFPGDVFYLHSRLLERAGRISRKLGGGSMTALPIIETQMGDLTAYIPTNVISITDGQIFLEGDLFNAGVRPAINAGLSVSRVSGAAQYPALRTVAGRLRLELAQYRELVAFSQFGTDLDRATQDTLDRGALLVEVFKQDQHYLVSWVDQVALYYAVIHGHLKSVPLDRVSEFERSFIQFLSANYQGLRNGIVIEKALTPELSQTLDRAISEHKSAFEVTE